MYNEKYNSIQSSFSKFKIVGRKIFLKLKMFENQIGTVSKIFETW